MWFIGVISDCYLDNSMEHDEHNIPFSSTIDISESLSEMSKLILMIGISRNIAFLHVYP